MIEIKGIKICVNLRMFPGFLASRLKRIETPSLPTLRRCYLAAFTLITRTASCSRQLPSCVAVYPRDFPIATCSMSLIPFAPFLLLLSDCTNKNKHVLKFMKTHKILNHLSENRAVGPFRKNEARRARIRQASGNFQLFSVVRARSPWR